MTNPLVLKSILIKIMIELNNIENSSFENYLPKVPSQFVDEVILDPPYFKVVNEKWDNQWKSLPDYLKWFETLMIHVERVSKFSCSLWIFGFPYQLSFIIPIVEKYGFRYKQAIIIDKGIKSVAGRTSHKLKMFPTATEHVLFFYKDSHNLVRSLLRKKQEELKISSKDINIHLGKAINGGGTWSSIAGKKQSALQYPTKDDWIKLEKLFGDIYPYDDIVYKFNQEPGLTDVWRDINFYDRSMGKRIHPTQKPYDLIKRIVKCSSNENDVVMDVFMGSGMTAKVCKDLKRNFIGCEKEREYFEKSIDFIGSIHDKV